MNDFLNGLSENVKMDNCDICPECGANWRGELIAEELLHVYGGKTHYSRLIGLYSADYDRTVAWMCPDCGMQWPRG